MMARLLYYVIDSAYNWNNPLCTWSASDSLDNWNSGESVPLQERLLVHVWLLPRTAWLGSSHPMSKLDKQTARDNFYLAASIGAQRNLLSIFSGAAVTGAPSLQPVTLSPTRSDPHDGRIRHEHGRHRRGRRHLQRRSRRPREGAAVG
jgi:hypothetical protein